MTVMALGRDWNGELLFPAREQDDVANELRAALERNVAGVRALAKATQGGLAHYGSPLEGVDITNPRDVGWSVLLHADDAANTDLRAALDVLARHRGADLTKPLVYRDEPAAKWLEWLHAEYLKRDEDGGVVPRYVVIVGGPERVPFAFQAFLQTFAHVGRVAFGADLDALAAYATKVVRLETAAEPVVDRRAVMFGPDGGIRDATHYSRMYMVNPLAAHVREKLRVPVDEIVEDDATKEGLVAALSGSRPALVYTASHGLGASSQPIDVQRRYNGAICCQTDGAQSLESMFSADDVPTDRPFLEGSVFFQFACYGFGTPARSDFAHWLPGTPANNATADFVAALPTKLLSHPRGPIAFVGHLDIALLLGFTDAEQPFLTKRWHTRIAPFRSAVERLLAVRPTGYALERMNQKYAAANALLTSHYDAEKREERGWTSKEASELVDTWLARGDAQNFMVLGDPAARVRIPAEAV
jgi:hypothetical protein